MSPVIVASEPRQRMIETAAVVMRERGVEATSFSEVIARSGAPRGSIYHHFPGGKAQLIEEATRYAAEWTASSLANALWQEDPIAAIRALAASWLRLLRKSDYRRRLPGGRGLARGTARAGRTRGRRRGVRALAAVARRRHSSRTDSPPSDPDRWRRL